VTLVLEGIGDGKSRCTASRWSDTKVILEDQVFWGAHEGQAIVAAAKEASGRPGREGASRV